MALLRQLLRVEHFLFLYTLDITMFTDMHNDVCQENGIVKYSDIKKILVEPVKRCKVNISFTLHFFPLL